MPIVVRDGCTMITGPHIQLYRMMVLRSGLRLEMKGLSRRGRSIYAIVKDEFGLRGTRERVLAQLEKRIEDYGNDIKEV